MRQAPRDIEGWVRRFEAALKADAGASWGAEAAGEGLGPVPGPEQVEALREPWLAHYRLLLKWSGRARLVGDLDPREVASRHFLDALPLFPFFESLPAGAQVVDIGSGAGFPALAVAPAFPELRFHLVESDRRKLAFLKVVIAGLGLSQARASGTPAAGDPAGEGVPLGALVLSRAFTGPAAWLSLARSYCAPGGQILCLTGGGTPKEEVEAAAAAAGLLPGARWSGSLPGGRGERAISAWRLA